ncbi:Sensor histidine kinase DesK [Actinomadura rubteroloni]|uniref:Sensor histidine kinase DesK n=1 Tax=Actinomadura rubteroloni TaxID=1926885 RepID=A0A2P4UNK0_9ACTN|nr:sensor histidine kinase [Actinomadura rubteroloni]POM26633.1 Sensor histidine kinase DesK [Actinomadura rubteroloni]
MDESAPPWTRGRRRLLLSAGMFAYPAATAVGVAQYARGGRAVAGYALAAAFAVCYPLAALAAARRAPRAFWALLGVLAALFLAELPLTHVYAFYIGAVVVAAAAAFAPRYAAAIVAAGVLACLAVPWAVWRDDPGWFQAVLIVFTAAAVYAFTELAAANTEVRAARAEVARLASEAERTRIARDLHDLLGHSLTVITVKSGLARRLSATDPERAGREIAEVETLSRQALTDVRAAVSGYRQVTLAGELARGRELLRAAGIDADLPATVDVVDAAHRELFGWVVREGLTNVVRHARASRCTITLSAAHVEIHDDGRGGTPSSGSGLAGLRERVAAAGGRIEAGPARPRGWRLRVTVEGGA